MADKNIKLKTKSGDVLLPVTTASNVSYGAIDSGVSIEQKIANVWDKDNLKSGKNVKIEKHINPNVITDETFSVWHFNNSTDDTIGKSIAYYGEWQFSSANKKFGSHSVGSTSSYGVMKLGQTDSNKFRNNTSFTFDTWFGLTGIAYDNNPSSFGFSTTDGGYGANWGRGTYLRVAFLSNKITFSTNTGVTRSYDISYPTGWAWGQSAFHHVAIMYTNGSAYLYLDGKLQSDYIITGMGEANWSFRGIYLIPQGGYLDEARLSAAAVYQTDSDFDVPEEEYSTSSGPDYWELNTTGLAKSTDVATKQDTLVAGTNISIAADGKTISATDTTYSAFTGTDGSAAGTAGLVPAPATTDTGKFLKADGTWAEVQGGGVAVPTLTWYTSADWTLSADGLTLTIADTSSANLVKVYRNGVLLQPNADYTISGTSLVVPTALTATEKITLEVY